MKRHKYTLADYWEDRFAFDHEKNAMYDEPLFPWWLCLIFAIIVILAFVADSHAQSVMASPMTIQVMKPNGAQVILICDPVMVDEEWTHRVKNCKLQNGALIEDVVNSMYEMNQVNISQMKEEQERLRRVGLNAVRAGEGALSLSQKWHKHYEECMASVDKFSKAVR